MGKLKLFSLSSMHLFSGVFLLWWCAETSPLDSLTPTKVGVAVKINVLFEDDGFF